MRHILLALVALLATLATTIDFEHISTVDLKQIWYVPPAMRIKEGVHVESGLNWPPKWLKRPTAEVPWISYEVRALVDTSRPDPYNNTESRRILISMFAPIRHEMWSRGFGACNEINLKYMPHKTHKMYNDIVEDVGVPSRFLDNNRMRVCDPIARRRGYRFVRTKKRQWPVVFFVPGFGTSRLMYSLQTRALADRGYVVIALDSPGETNIVEFPNGETVYGMNISDANPETDQFHAEVRAADITFILNQLENPLFSTLSPSMDTGKAWAYGHGLGGSAVALAMNNDPRINGGVNFDGAVWGEPAESGVDKPFLLIGSSLVNGATSAFGDFYSKIKAKKMHLRIKQTTHLSFWDMPSWLVFWRKVGPVETLPVGNIWFFGHPMRHRKAYASTVNTHTDIPMEAAPGIDAALGAVDYEKLWWLRTDILDSFGALVSKGQGSKRLNALSGRYKQIEVVEKDLG